MPAQGAWNGSRFRWREHAGTGSITTRSANRRRGGRGRTQPARERNEVTLGAPRRRKRSWLGEDLGLTLPADPELLALILGLALEDPDASCEIGFEDLVELEDDDHEKGALNEAVHPVSGRAAPVGGRSAGGLTGSSTSNQDRRRNQATGFR